MLACRDYSCNLKLTSKYTARVEIKLLMRLAYNNMVPLTCPGCIREPLYSAWRYGREFVKSLNFLRLNAHSGEQVINLLSAREQTP